MLQERCRNTSQASRVASAPGVVAKKLRALTRPARQPECSHHPPLEQLAVQHRVAGGERAVVGIAGQAADVHFQLGVQVVGVMEDEALGNERQARRTPLGQGQMREDEMLEELHQFGINISLGKAPSPRRNNRVLRIKYGEDISVVRRRFISRSQPGRQT